MPVTCSKKHINAWVLYGSTVRAAVEKAIHPNVIDFPAPKDIDIICDAGTMRLAAAFVSNIGSKYHEVDNLPDYLVNQGTLSTGGLHLHQTYDASILTNMSLAQHYMSSMLDVDVNSFYISDGRLIAGVDSAFDSVRKLLPIPMKPVEQMNAKRRLKYYTLQSKYRTISQSLWLPRI